MLATDTLHSYNTLVHRHTLYHILYATAPRTVVVIQMESPVVMVTEGETLVQVCAVKVGQTALQTVFLLATESGSAEGESCWGSVCSGKSAYKNIHGVHTYVR